ncbi:RNA ligase RtcB family protein [Ralstonia flaminis]|jgi:release factor H-coupled RctB family protein|uniref:3'-phosphate/5'-hydroxy nucleic acid ligase n=1 Tax=Ralstonia flaminis TaxID=3058597 RepID=A0ABM9K824_9RALS|nr:RNA ligase RtcB family protein [Ralstonia sp. LMG 18101]CAJ0818899.1 RNA-splicing ligase RtcB [Ralstonia sp. LMG 18101]
MGNCILHLFDGGTLIASDDTWIEGDAIRQLQTTKALDGMRHVAGMPDLHPGRGYPVGAAFFSVARLYPALIGGDIGCGMTLWATDIEANKVSLDKLDKRLGNIDTPLDESWRELVAALAPVGTGFDAALGTIGGGNHFAELLRVDTIYDEAAGISLNPRQLLLLAHSGSRGLGQAILEEQVRAHGHSGLSQDDPACAAYLERHDTALRFAKANRELIARRMLDRLHAQGKPLLDVHHNFVAPATVHGERGWLHRKGATPSDAGVVVIPGSRGDYSYLVAPLPSEHGLFSLAHGAGRKWMRSDCKDRLVRRFTPAQLNRTKLGSHVICEDKQLIYEEAPEAYKSIDSVIAPLVDAGLVKVLARLRPVLTYKTRGECC